MIKKWYKNENQYHFYKGNCLKNPNISSKITFEPFERPIMGAKHEI